MRLIDADALSNELDELLKKSVKMFCNNDQQDIGYTLAIYDVAEHIDGLPTIGPVKRGRWKADGAEFVKCSVCGQIRKSIFPFANDDFNYCPSCGAKMDGENNESK